MTNLNPSHLTRQPITNSLLSPLPTTSPVDTEMLFGWDNLPGIVSVWADRTGRALVWQRAGTGAGENISDRPGSQASWGGDAPFSFTSEVRCYREQFRPWVIAAHLDDLHHLGAALVEASAPGADRAAFTYRKLTTSSTSSIPSSVARSSHAHTSTTSPSKPIEATLRYFIAAQDGRALNRAILTRAEKRLGRGQGQRPSQPEGQGQHPHPHQGQGQSFTSMRDLPQDEYYWVGPVEQYLMLTGRVYFRGMVYSDLHRLQFDLETTGLSPKESRIFLVAVKDTHGLETILEAPRPDQEAQLILDLCALIRERTPDVIENHNLFGFDLPFLQERARSLGVPLILGRAEVPLSAQTLEH